MFMGERERGLKIMSRRRPDRISRTPLPRFRRRHAAEPPSPRLASINRDLRIVSHSPGWREWLGDTRLDGREVRDVFGSEAAGELRPAFDAALGGRPARAAAWIRSPSRGPRRIDVLCIPQSSESGEIRGFFAVATEIPGLRPLGATEPERLRRNVDARSEEERLGLALETAEVGTWDWDLRSGRCTWNARLGRLWGLPPAAQGDRGIFLANIHPQDRGRVGEILKDALRPGPERAISVEFRTTSPIDGQERWLSAHLRVGRDPTGKPLRLVGTAVDVSGRKSVEAELAYRRTLLESENEAALDGILVVDTAGRMVSFNRRFVQMWNIPPEIVASRSDEAAIASVLHSLVSPDEFLAQVRYLYAHAEEVSRDELGLKDGRIFDRFSAPIRSSDGTHYGRVWFFRDVTEQKRNVEVLRDGAARLEEALLELNTFAYSVAHDLRAPLRAIAGFSDLLREDYAAVLPSAAREYVLRITENAKRMDTLIMDLLTYSRLTREQMPNETVELRSLLAEILVRLEPEFQLSGARLDVSGPYPRVLAHRTSLDQVITNLLTNAIKFVSTGVPPRVGIRIQEKRDRVRLWVEDNGIGIAPEHLDRIFGVFQRLHSLADYSGTGIGLAIVKRAMERMGGQVGVESEPGKGSRFWIELKRAPPATPG
jgi:PAS domain S-box-containing protein